MPENNLMPRRRLSRKLRGGQATPVVNEAGDGEISSLSGGRRRRRRNQNTRKRNGRKSRRQERKSRRHQRKQRKSRRQN